MGLYPGCSWLVLLLLLSITSSVTSQRLRLMGGPTASRGRLEVFYNGEWGTVCDDQFDTRDAEVACRQLGYHGSYAHILRSNTYPKYSGPIHLDDVFCHGNELTLAACYYPGLGRHDCFHSEDVNLECTLTTVPTTPTTTTTTPNSAPNGPEVRLVGGPGANEGRLEVYHAGQWGTVCDGGFGFMEGWIACKQLGYNDIAHITTNTYPTYRKPIHLDEVNCHLYDRHLGECDHAEWGENDCDHTKDVNLVCTAALAFEMAVMNFGNSDDSTLTGFPVVLHHGAMGGICKVKSADANKVSNVICRERGYDRGEVYHPAQEVPFTWTMLEDVECGDNVAHLYQCSYNASICSACHDTLAVRCENSSHIGRNVGIALAVLAPVVVIVMIIVLIVIVRKMTKCRCSPLPSGTESSIMATPTSAQPLIGQPSTVQLPDMAPQALYPNMVDGAVGYPNLAYVMPQPSPLPQHETPPPYEVPAHAQLQRPQTMFALPTALPPQPMPQTPNSYRSTWAETSSAPLEATKAPSNISLWTAPTRSSELTPDSPSAVNQAPAQPGY